MTGEKAWHVVYTRPRWEKKVAESLTRKQIENYCPLNRTINQWADRKKIVYQPLFSSYVFVRTCEKELLTIKQTKGILNLVYWLGKPARIKEEEIEAIRSFLLEHTGVKLEKIKVTVTDRVRITEGPLIHLEGNVLEVKSRSVKVTLPSLHYALIAEVPLGSLELVQPKLVPLKENVPLAEPVVNTDNVSLHE